MTNWLRPRAARAPGPSMTRPRISSAPPRRSPIFEAAHRSATLEMVASGKLTAGQAIARVDAVALMSRLTHHAWRAVAHLNRAAASRMELPQ